MANKISIYRGTTYDFTYKHTDPSGAAVPLTGKKLYFTVKDVESDSDATDTSAIIQKTVNSAQHTDAAGGISAFQLTDADTYKAPGDYFFDVIIEDEATGRADPPSLIGAFTIKPQPTNRNVGNET